MLHHIEQANIAIKYRTNLFWHHWWVSCFVMTVCLKFLLPLSLLLHSTACSSYPQLPYSVPHSFVILFGSPFQNKSAFKCSTSQSCLTQPLQLFCFCLSLSPALKQENFSVQWYLWTLTGKISYRNLHTRCIPLQNLKKLVMIPWLNKIICRPSAHVYLHTPFLAEVIWKSSNLCVLWLCCYNKYSKSILLSSNF